MSVNETYIICDNSGSMAENGKPFILRNTIRSIIQMFRIKGKNPDINLIVVSESISEFKLSYESDVPLDLLVCSGKFEDSKIIEFLPKITTSNLIVNTDGCWERDFAKKFAKLLHEKFSNNFKIIKIANEPNSVLRGDNVFKCHELFGVFG